MKPIFFPPKLAHFNNFGPQKYRFCIKIRRRDLTIASATSRENNYTTKTTSCLDTASRPRTRSCPLSVSFLHPFPFVRLFLFSLPAKGNSVHNEFDIKQLDSIRSERNEISSGVSERARARGCSNGNVGSKGPTLISSTRDAEGDYGSGSTWSVFLGPRCFMFNHDGPWRVTAGNVLYRRRERPRERERARERERDGKRMYVHRGEASNESKHTTTTCMSRGRRGGGGGRGQGEEPARVLGARNQVGRW